MFIKKGVGRILRGLLTLCLLPALLWFSPVMPQALASEQIAPVQDARLIIADNPVEEGLDRLKAESAADKAEGIADEATGKIQRSVGKVTGQTEGTLKQAQGQTKQAMGEAKENLSEAGDKADNASESFIDKVKDFFD